MNSPHERPDPSHPFALPARELARRRESRRILKAINAAHDDLPDPAQDFLQACMRARQRELLVLTPGDVEA
jgi:hypothetical protein